MAEGARAGKLIGLSALLREQRNAIEADLHRYYGIDLLDFYRGRISLRKLAVLVEGLPAEATVYRNLQPEAAGWDIHTYLLAGILDALNDANWQRAEGKAHNRPERVPRPYDIAVNNAKQRRRDEVLQLKVNEWRAKQRRNGRKELTA